MPRYFFDVYDGRDAVRDEFGAEAEGVRQAADEAASLLAELARDALPGGQCRDFAALVRDEAGRVVYRAALLFRGEGAAAAIPPFTATVSAVTLEVARAKRLREDARELRRRLRANVRDLMMAIEASMALTGARAGPRGKLNGEAP